MIIGWNNDDMKINKIQHNDSMEVLGVRNYNSDKSEFFKTDFLNVDELRVFLNEVATGESDITQKGKDFLLKMDIENVAEKIAVAGGIQEENAMTKSEIINFVKSAQPFFTREFIVEARGEEQRERNKNDNDNNLTTSQ